MYVQMDFMFDLSHIFEQVYKEDIVVVRANGIVVRCPGLFQGEVIILVNESHKSIVVALMALKGDVDIFKKCFTELCQNKFIQCIFNIWVENIITK